MDIPCEKPATPQEEHVCTELAQQAWGRRAFDPPKPNYGNRPLYPGQIPGQLPEQMLGPEQNPYGQQQSCNDGYYCRGYGGESNYYSPYGNGNGHGDRGYGQIEGDLTKMLNNDDVYALFGLFPNAGE